MAAPIATFRPHHRRSPGGASRPGTAAAKRAIGPAGGRRASARQPAQLALSPEMSATEIAEIKCARWQQALDAALKEAGKSWADAASAPKGVGGKVAIARTRRTPVAAPYRWIATPWQRGHPAAVRGDLSTRTWQSADLPHRIAALHPFACRSYAPSLPARLRREV